MIAAIGLLLFLQAAQSKVPPPAAHRGGSVVADEIAATVSSVDAAAKATSVPALPSGGLPLPEGNVTQVNDVEKIDLLKAQREVQNQELIQVGLANKAKALSDQAAAQSSAIKAANDSYTSKIEALRSKYKLGSDAFFNSADIQFISPPKPAGKK